MTGDAIRQLDLRLLFETNQGRLESGQVDASSIRVDCYKTVTRPSIRNTPALIVVTRRSYIRNRKDFGSKSVVLVVLEKHSATVSEDEIFTGISFIPAFILHTFKHATQESWTPNTTFRSKQGLCQEGFMIDPRQWPVIAGACSKSRAGCCLETSAGCYRMSILFK